MSPVSGVWTSEGIRTPSIYSGNRFKGRHDMQMIPFTDALDPPAVAEILRETSQAFPKRLAETTARSAWDGSKTPVNGGRDGTGKQMGKGTPFRESCFRSISPSG
jgi:hypothetical protein